jgi:hypothetical protein
MFAPLSLGGLEAAREAVEVGIHGSEARIVERTLIATGTCQSTPAWGHPAVPKRRLDRWRARGGVGCAT